MVTTWLAVVHRMAAYKTHEQKTATTAGPKKTAPDRHIEQQPSDDDDTSLSVALLVVGVVAGLLTTASLFPLMMN